MYVKGLTSYNWLYAQEWVSQAGSESHSRAEQPTTVTQPAAVVDATFKNNAKERNTNVGVGNNVWLPEICISPQTELTKQTKYPFLQGIPFHGILFSFAAL